MLELYELRAILRDEPQTRHSCRISELKIDRWHAWNMIEALHDRRKDRLPLNIWMLGAEPMHE